MSWEKEFIIICYYLRIDLEAFALELHLRRQRVELHFDEPLLAYRSRIMIGSQIPLV